MTYSELQKLNEVDFLDFYHYTEGNKHTVTITAWGIGLLRIPLPDNTYSNLLICRYVDYEGWRELWIQQAVVIHNSSLAPVLSMYQWSFPSTSTSFSVLPLLSVWFSLSITCHIGIARELFECQLCSSHGACYASSFLYTVLPLFAFFDDTSSKAKLEKSCYLLLDL